MIGEDALASVQAAPPPELEAAVRDFAQRVLVARLAPAHRDRRAELAAIDRLRALLATSAAFADVLGREMALEESEPVTPRGIVLPRRFAEEDAPELSPEARKLRGLLGLGFDGAVEQMVLAVPEIARNQDEIRSVYDRGGFALVRAADLAVTKAVQDVIARATAEGKPIKTVEGAMEALDASFTPAYSKLVFQNATTRAHAAGRQRQARELPGVVGLEYLATRDADVRANHLAADGVIAAVDDPTWNRISPPLYHGCRCAQRLVMRVEALRLGIELDERGLVAYPTIPGQWRGRPGDVPPGAGPDEPGGSWGRRADSIYRIGGDALAG